MPKFKLEDFLLPHEVDKDGKKLAEPNELDLDKLRKWVYGLLTDKEEAQEVRDTAIAERDKAKDDLSELQRQNENEEQRRAREDKEREQRYAEMDKRDLERRKIEALEEAYPDATASRIRRLAKRVTGDEKDWLDDAKELVEDGFKLSDKPAGETEETVETEETLETVPRTNVRRSNGGTVKQASSKPRSPADELDAAGVGNSGW